VVSPVQSSSLPTSTSHESAADRTRIIGQTLASEARAIGRAEEERLRKLDTWKSRATWAAAGVAIALGAWGLWRWRKG